MPAMIRPTGKAKKIAFAILGKPANMQPQPKRVKKLRKALAARDIDYVRGA